MQRPALPFGGLAQTSHAEAMVVDSWWLEVGCMAVLGGPGGSTSRYTAVIYIWNMHCPLSPVPVPHARRYTVTELIAFSLTGAVKL